MLWGSTSLYADNEFFTVDDMLFRMGTDQTAQFCGVSQSWKQATLAIPESVKYGDTTYPVVSMTGLDSRFDGISNSVMWHSNSYIKEVIIPESMKYIEHYALSSYPLITKVTVPKSVEVFDILAMYNCVNVKELVFENGSKALKFQDSQSFKDVYREIQTTYGLFYPSYDQGYRNWFQGCNALSRIFIGRNVNKESGDIFKGLSSIDSFELGDSVTVISSCIFSDIHYSDAEFKTKIKSLTIPAGVSEIEPGALALFKRFPVSIKVDADNAKFYSPEGCSAIVERDSETLIWGNSETIPAGIRSIAANAFYGSGISSITIPNTVTAIGELAFAYCSNLKKIVLPESVTALPAMLLFRCDALESLTIPSTVTTFAFGVFAACPSLKEVNFEGDLPGYNPVNLNAQDLQTLYENPQNGRFDFSFVSKYEYLPDYYKVRDYITLYGCIPLIYSFGWLYHFPPGGSAVELISKTDVRFNFKSFANYYHGNSIEDKLARKFIPTSRLFFDGKQFDGNLTLSEGTVNLSYCGFYKEGSSEYDAPARIHILTIPASLESIDEGAQFDVDEIHLPKSKLSMVAGVFKNCGKYVVTDGEQEPVIYSEDGTRVLFCNRDYTGRILLPEQVTAIDNNAFEGCIGLERIIMEGVMSIGSKAFASCSQLNKVILPDTIMRIASDAFEGCTELVTAGPLGGDYNVEYTWTSMPRDPFVAFPNVTAISIGNEVTDFEFTMTDNITYLSIDYSVERDEHYLGEMKNLKVLDISGGNFNPQNLTPYQSVESLVFGYGVTGFNPKAIGSMPNLQEFGCSPVNPYFTAVGGVLFSKDKETILSYPLCQPVRYDIPEGTKAIGANAFYKSPLVTLTIPSSVTDIDPSAFTGCGSLTTLRLESDAPIAEGTFMGCTSLTDIIVTSDSPSVLHVSNKPKPFVFQAEDIIMRGYDSYGFVTSDPRASDGKVWYMTGVGGPGYDCFFEIPGHQIPSGDYNYFISILPNTIDGRPNKIHGILRSYDDNGNPTKISDPISGSGPYKKPVTKENNMEKTDTILMDSITLPDGFKSLEFTFQSRIITTSDLAKYSPNILFDCLIFCPKDTDDARLCGPFSNNTYANCRLHVQSGKSDAYKSALGWSLFANIADDAAGYRMPDVEIKATAVFHTNYEGAPSQEGNYISLTGNTEYGSHITATATYVPGFVANGWSEPMEFIANSDVNLTVDYFMAGDINGNGVYDSLDVQLWQSFMYDVGYRWALQLPFNGIESYGSQYFDTDITDNEHFKIVRTFYWPTYQVSVDPPKMVLTKENFDIDQNGIIDAFDFYTLLWLFNEKHGIYQPGIQTGTAPDVQFSINDLTFDQSMGHFSETPLTVSMKNTGNLVYAEFDLYLPAMKHGVSVAVNPNWTIISQDGYHYRMVKWTDENEQTDALLQFIFPDVGITSHLIEMKDISLFDSKYGRFSIADISAHLENPSRVEGTTIDSDMSRAYDLNGRHVGTVTKGLYIINGKVVFK